MGLWNRTATESGRNPLPVLWTVLLPVNQVLEASSSTAGAELATHSVDGVPIEQSWRWWWDQGTPLDWLDLGHMVRGMNLHGTKELEPDCYWVDNLLDVKGSDKLGCQLLGFNVSWIDNHNLCPT